ncbi:hypothetical protein QGM71_00180 [Virgibacillus sp. C22-A2]|uniref:Uncharacterized protein n=1 Tax=Virgibacillus tibetensis TaxID=3042313 RepID=A0ABU6K9Y9_9BACI|nr:hypothetical protein [Virgibacillus sp. C22-A2]
MGCRCQESFRRRRRDVRDEDRKKERRSVEGVRDRDKHRDRGVVEGVRDRDKHRDQRVAGRFTGRRFRKRRKHC